MNRRTYNKAALTKLPFFLWLLMLFFLACGKTQTTNELPSSEPITPQKEYTADNPREWAGMEEQLIPQIVFNQGFGPDIIVRVNLKNPSPSNYIEKIGIVDKNGKELVYDVFSPHEKFFEAHFSSSDLPFDKSGLKVFSKSSLYDLWTTPLPLKTF